MAEMTIDKAIERLKAEYERAKNLEYVRNPLAYALYQVWKIADGESNVRNVTAESAITALQDAAREFKDVPPDAYLGLMIGSTMQY